MQGKSVSFKIQFMLNNIIRFTLGHYMSLYASWALHTLYKFWFQVPWSKHTHTHTHTHTQFLPLSAAIKPWCSVQVFEGFWKVNIQLIKEENKNWDYHQTGSEISILLSSDTFWPGVEANQNPEVVSGTERDHFRRNPLVLTIDMGKPWQ
jgi:hypothetical protein